LRLIHSLRRLTHASRWGGAHHPTAGETGATNLKEILECRFAADTARVNLWHNYLSLAKAVGNAGTRKRLTEVVMSGRVSRRYIA